MGKGFVLGMDSGGTKFRVLASALDGTGLATYTGTTASHYYLPQDEMVKRINHHVDECLAQFGGERQDCRYLLCGTTGIDSDEDRQLVNEIYGSLPGFACPVECINDAELAHYATTGGKGALVISGTGSITFGRNQKGQTARTGGWLFSIMGDEGSGTWVARHALRHLGKWFDGAAAEGPLVQLVRGQLGIHTRKQLMDLSTQIATPPWEVPRLGQAVDKAAGQGDPVAKALLEEAAQNTFNLLSSLIEILRLDEEGHYPVGVWGSNILNSPVHLAAFSEMMAARHPAARLALPTRSAERAAADLALTKLAG